ncbi:hypothetical protein RVZ43_004682 [Salmonella enterica subsp. enterica serovar Infantis]|nr:hypothetical protein [Salmonella enterica subsp. enterica serovar Infantis]
MSQQSLSTFLHASLLVRDIHGHYLPATDKQILDAACQIIDLKMQRGAQFTAASSTRDYRHCCKVSDEAAFCLIQRPYISKTLLTRRISPRGSP